MVHGLFGSMENLGMIARLLKDDFCIYGLDLPNHGRSPHVSSLSLASMAEWVVHWMETVGVDQALFLGHSLGGKVSMEVALRYPDKVQSLVVADIAPVAYPPRHDDVFAGFEAVDLAQLTRRADADQAMQTQIIEASVRSFLLKNLEKTDQGWVWRLNLEGLKRDYPEFIKANSDNFPAFKRPVLFIKGERSNYILPEHKADTLKRFPSADIKIINDTEHWLHAEKPELFSRIVRRFLDKVAT